MDDLRSQLANIIVAVPRPTSRRVITPTETDTHHERPHVTRRTSRINACAFDIARLITPLDKPFHINAGYSALSLGALDSFGHTEGLR